ncbi:MAG: P-type conjugative transfer protein TrbL [Kiloniellales bacterium]|nr:P-type conjugative transfer protein TrbL [Kiloniellales bacterium]
MGDLNVIDTFTQTFIRYIDSGFGLLTGDVWLLTTVLIKIDIVLAGLMWAMREDNNVIAQLIRKILYVGFFAYILNNFQFLANVLFASFGSIGLKASGTSLQPGQLLNPGFIASSGFSAAHPLLEKAGESLGILSIWGGNVVLALILFVAYLVVLVSFFILAIQLFITLIEFKLTTLAGFLLVPFALWGKTAFLAERVLGNVVASGIKLMVLAVIVGIGSTIFNDMASALDGVEIELRHAMAMMLASLALLGLGIFGPSIASGLVSGAPQLGAGAAVGTAGAAVAGGLAAGGAALGTARLGLGALKAATAVGSGVGAAYGLARATSGATGLAGVAAGSAGVARAGAGLIGQGVKGATSGIRTSAQAGRRGAITATGGSTTGGQAPVSVQSSSTQPAWARRLQAEQRIRARTATAAQAVKEGDKPGAGINPRLDDKDD